MNLPRKSLVVTALALTGLAIFQPAWAQEKWRPAEAVIVTAKPVKNWRDLLTSSHLGSAIVVTASVPVSYHDLNLRQDPDVAKFDNRIDIAADLVCRELDLRYPEMIYPRLDAGDCPRDARDDGHAKADAVIAKARQ